MGALNQTNFVTQRMPLKTLIPDDEPLHWDCDSCEAETQHEVEDEVVTPAGNEYYIDTRIRCEEWGHEHEVTEATPTDPRT